MNWKIGVAGVAAAMGLACQVSAAEGGGSAYKDGAEGLMTGALPPPGQYLVNYLLYYQADSYKQANGDSMPGKFKLQVFGDLVRFVNVTPYEILGANWAQQFFVQGAWQHVRFDAAGAKDDQIGIGDIIVDPFILGWHKPPFHWVVGMDTYIPVGQYDKNEPASVGRNCWTFQPVVAATYLDGNGIEVSAKLMYDFNTKNRDTGVTSGQAFHADFAAALHRGAWAGGVCGFVHAQTTDDKDDAGNRNDSRANQVGLGPVLSYQHGAMNFSLAYQQEFATENRPEGDRVWFKFMTPL